MVTNTAATIENKPAQSISANARGHSETREELSKPESRYPIQGVCMNPLFPSGPDPATVCFPTAENVDPT